MDYALLVGINSYPDPANHLNGCLNDIDDMQQFLIASAGFQSGNITALKDADANTDAIKIRLRNIIAAAQSGDRLVFHYSGHGCEMPEIDGAGNTIAIHDAMCPYDFDWTEAHSIRDSDFQTLFAAVPSGTRLSWISDSCYSGGYAKLFALFTGASTLLIKTIPPPPAIHAQIVAYQQKVSAERMTMRAMVQTLQRVLLFSACTSTQEATDATFGGRPNGALTYCLLQQLETPSGLTEAAQQVLSDVNLALQKGSFAQNPELHGDPSLFVSPVLG